MAPRAWPRPRCRTHPHGVALHPSLASQRHGRMEMGTWAIGPHLAARRAPTASQGLVATHITGSGSPVRRYAVTSASDIRFNARSASSAT